MNLNPNEIIETDEENFLYTEEDRENPDQIEVPKKMEPDLPFSMTTRESGR